MAKFAKAEMEAAEATLQTDQAIRARKLVDALQEFYKLERKSTLKPDDPLSLEIMTILIFSCELFVPMYKGVPTEKRPDAVADMIDAFCRMLVDLLIAQKLVDPEFAGQLVEIFKKRAQEESK